MDAFLLSRIQFAINISFHYLFPPISIGLGLMLVIMEGLYLKTKRQEYFRMTVFWTRIFALVFAMGVATGLVQGFAFGTNWARFSRFVGDVFGSALAAEGMFAFFLEAGFLGVVLFGWNRVKPAIHYLATLCVCFGAHFSAVWIIVANSWMQTPAGFTIEETPLGPRAVIVNFWEMVFNPSSMDRLGHVLLGCWLTGAFFVISVAAFYLLKRRHEEIARPMMKIALGVASVSLILQLFSGDESAKYVAQYQPPKFAAFEGVYETGPATPLFVAGWVDAKREKAFGIKIPALLSILTYGNPKEAVPGLDQVPRDEWPNVPLVFQAYHLMIMTWVLMVLVACLGGWALFRGTLQNKKWLLWCMVFSVLLPHIGQQMGWMAAEVGRQPWIVWKLLRTSEGVSLHLSKGQLIGSISLFLVMYVLLFALFLFLLDRKIKHGPDPSAYDENVYTQRD